jgi:antitoxin component of MazEF toxin-antitoxin module
MCILYIGACIKYYALNSFGDFSGGKIIMVKKLIQHGNSAALVIDKPIMEMLNITNETFFELSTDGKNIILSPQNTITQENNILESLRKINKKYGNVLKRLGE